LLRKETNKYSGTKLTDGDMLNHGILIGDVIKTQSFYNSILRI